jgi:hypothetical protein
MQKEKSIQLFIDHTDEFYHEMYIDIEEKEGREIKRGKVEEYIKSFLELHHIDIQIINIRNNKTLFESLIRYLKEKPDTSIRTISNVLNVNRNTVQRIK